MNTYSQNKEDIFVLDYFKDYTGNLLDIGANDGATFSNSRLLIEQGWNGHLLEPGLSAFAKLAKLYADSWHATIHRVGIGEHDELVTFYESGAHVKNGADIGLVSSTIYSETERWRKSGVEFDEVKIRLVDWKTFYERCNGCNFDFVSIDCEGLEWIILKQIDLDDIGCKCLCIEWNGNAELRSLYTDYCATFGLKLAKFNAENLIFVR